jgi:hypothetical protein
MLSALTILTLSPAYGDWDYHGSGRDHPYSYYIDRANYIGPADYVPIEPGYLSGPLALSTVRRSPALTAVAATPVVQPEEFIVNIPNAHGGYNEVVIKKYGDGYKGPFGEYYPEFPKIFQLQMKYGN